MCCGWNLQEKEEENFLEFTSLVFATQLSNYFGSIRRRKVLKIGLLGDKKFYQSRAFKLLVYNCSISDINLVLRIGENSM